MRGAVDATICDKVSQWLATDQWFPPCTPVSSTNKADCHDIIEILLKVALNVIILTHTVHMNSRGNASLCNASDVWSSCENLKINTSKILVRLIVSQSVNRYHDLNDVHDSSMQSADNRHTTDIFFVLLVHTNEPVLEIVIDFAGFLLLFCFCLALVLILEVCSVQLLFYLEYLSSYWMFVPLSLCFCRIICSYIVFFVWVLSEHLFSYSFFLCFFSENLFSYSICFLDIRGIYTNIVFFLSISSHIFLSVVFRSICSHIVLFGICVAGVPVLIYFVLCFLGASVLK